MNTDGPEYLLSAQIYLLRFGLILSGGVPLQPCLVLYRTYRFSVLILIHNEDILHLFREGKPLYPCCHSL